MADAGRVKKIFPDTKEKQVHVDNIYRTFVGQEDIKIKCSKMDFARCEWSRLDSEGSFAHGRAPFYVMFFSCTCHRMR